MSLDLPADPSPHPSPPAYATSKIETRDDLLQNTSELRSHILSPPPHHCTNRGPRHQINHIFHRSGIKVFCRPLLLTHKVLKLFNRPHSSVLIPPHDFPNDRHDPNLLI
ncbi:hypothetical protein RUND412_001964 [Rhizina undulata]